MDKKKKGLVAVIMEGKGGERKEEIREEGESEPSPEELLREYSKAMMEAIKNDSHQRFHEALMSFIDCYETHPHKEYEEEEEGEEEED
jgi:hypothetical protein